MLMASSIVPDNLSTCEKVQVDATNFSYIACIYDNVTVEDAFFNWVLPPNFESTSTDFDGVAFHWLSTGTGVVQWVIECDGKGDSDIWDTALAGNEFATTDTVTTAGDYQVTAYNTTVTHTIDSDDRHAICRVERDTSGSDTLNQPANLIAVEICYGVNDIWSGQ